MNLFDFINGNAPRRKQPETVPDGETAQALRLLRGGLIRRFVVLFLLILAAVLLTQVVVVTMPNEYKAIIQFGEVLSIIDRPGVSLKVPFIQTVTVIPRNVQFYDIPVTSVITQDKKTMDADSFVLWRVSEPYAYLRQGGGLQTQVEQFIGQNTYNSLQNVISDMPQADIISGRDTLAQLIFKNLGTSLNIYGVEIVAIETKSLDLPEENRQAVYERMISERNNIAAQYTAEGEEEYRLIKNETDKTANILISNAAAQAADAIAEGERQYMEILSGAYNTPERAGFYTFTRALDAAKNSLAGGGNTLILGRDSPLAQVFYGQ